jgi:hypothetical protein
LHMGKLAPERPIPYRDTMKSKESLRSRFDTCIKGYIIFKAISTSILSAQWFRSTTQKCLTFSDQKTSKSNQ